MGATDVFLALIIDLIVGFKNITTTFKQSRGSAFKISSKTLLTLTFATAVVPLRTVHFVEQVPPNLLIWFLS